MGDGGGIGANTSLEYVPYVPPECSGPSEDEEEDVLCVRARACGYTTFTAVAVIIGPRKKKQNNKKTE